MTVQTFPREPFDLRRQRRPPRAMTGQALTPGILHFGVGNFHRSHQAVYLDDLFNAGLDHDWALVGAGVFEAQEARSRHAARRRTG